MKRIHFEHIAIVILLAAAAAPALGKEDLSVQAAVERQEVFLGDSVLFQIQVIGNDEPEAPKLSGLTEFTVQTLGGQKNNRESVTVINGQMSREVQRAYVFSYRLTPKRTGELAIPSIEVHAAGQTLKTQPLSVHVTKPEESDDFKLRLALSRETCYVNEPVTLTVTWYIGRDVRNFEFNLPLLENKNFTFVDPDPQIDPQKKYLRIPLAGSVVIAENGQGSLNGKTYMTVSFRKVLIPRQAGTFAIPPATVACNALAGGQAAPNPFDDGLNYRRYVTPSNGLTLNVKDLPTRGQPADFSGLVGTYRLETSAVPTQVNVGDPITLTIKLQGPEYLKPVELPPLNRQPTLARNFKIPDEMAPGKIEGNTKIFTQTIRAINSNVKEIPPLELSYFDTRSGGYEIARTKPIPLLVKGTKEVTARDAEGRELTPVQNELKAWHEGIAHNYDDLGVLDNQEFGWTTMIRSPSGLALGILPPLAYFALLGITLVSRARQADPAGTKAKRAYGEFTKRLKHRLKSHSADDPRAFGEYMDAVRNYLGSKLRIPAAALTYRDVEPRLRERGVDDETLRGLKSIFDECEARRFAGSGSDSHESATTARRLADLVRKLERSLK